MLFLGLSLTYYLLRCQFLLFGLLVPLSGQLFFPILVFLYFVDAVLYDLVGQFDLVILHVLVVVQLIGEFKQLVDLLFLFFLLLLLGLGPSWLLAPLRFLALLAWLLGCFVFELGLQVEWLPLRLRFWSNL